MGLDAEVIAIGGFRKEIAEFLEYPADRYADTIPGVPVIVTVFQAVTTDQSYELAEYFGIHPWDFNKHVLDAFKVNVNKLKNSDFSKSLDQFIKLRDNAFSFYYLPRG